MVIFLCNLYIVVWLKHCCLANTVFALDKSSSCGMYRMGKGCISGHCSLLLGLFHGFGNKTIWQCVMEWINWAVPCENVSSGICRQWRPRSACASAQSDQGLHCPLTESLDTIKCINGKQMPGWDFAHEWDESESVHFVHVRRHLGPVVQRVVSLTSSLRVILLRVILSPASVAQLDAPSDWRPGGRGFNPRRGRQHSFVEIDYEIFSTVILSLPLIQEG